MPVRQHQQGGSPLVPAAGGAGARPKSRKVRTHWHWQALLATAHFCTWAPRYTPRPQAAQMATRWAFSVAVLPTVAALDLVAKFVAALCFLAFTHKRHAGRTPGCGSLAARAHGRAGAAWAVTLPAGGLTTTITVRPGPPPVPLWRPASPDAVVLGPLMRSQVGAGLGIAPHPPALRPTPLISPCFTRGSSSVPRRCFENGPARRSTRAAAEGFFSPFITGARSAPLPPPPPSQLVALRVGSGGRCTGLIPQGAPPPPQHAARGEGPASLPLPPP